MKRSVILLSGGLDSAANLGLCSLRDKPELAVTFDYGQRAARREIQAAASLAQYFKIEHQIIELPFIKSLGQSALTHDQFEMPHPESNELDQLELAQKTAAAVWVPNRNGIFLSIAAAIAESREIDQVVVGFNIEEAATFADNSSAFAAAFTNSLQFSTRNSVKVKCYTFDLNKSQIVALLHRDLPTFPFECIWSCYESGSQPCQKCESCKRLSRALKKD